MSRLFLLESAVILRRYVLSRRLLRVRGPEWGNFCLRGRGALRFYIWPPATDVGCRSSESTRVVTTMTGHTAWLSTVCEVEPSSMPAKPPRPRDPTTMRSTAVENSVRRLAPVPTRTEERRAG